MRRHLLGFLGLALPFAAWAQTAPDPAGQGRKTQGDLSGALSVYTQAIARNPRDVQAYLARGTVRGRRGDYAGAIADDTKAIALDPKNVSAFVNRGNAKTASGNLERARADYTWAIALDPRRVRAFLNRGNVENLRKNYRAAAGDYTKAIELDPKNGAAFYNRAGARRSLGDETGAVADYSEAIVLNPADVPAYLNRAVLRMAQQKWDEAATDLNRCLELVPEERQAYPRIYLWVLGAEQSKAGEASRTLALYLDHSSKILSNTWGWEIATFLSGRDDETHFLASAASFRARKDRNQIAQADYYAGLKRAAAGDQAGAMKYFKKCRKAGNPSVHEFILAGARMKFSGVSP